MKKFFLICISLAMGAIFVSCERASVQEDISPIRGVWECQLEVVWMTLDFGEKRMEFHYHMDTFGADAIYYGTYTLKDNILTLHYDSLKSKKVSHPIVQYIDPDKMPKEAILKDENTIIYLENTFKRNKP